MRFGKRNFGPTCKALKAFLCCVLYTYMYVVPSNVTYYSHSWPFRERSALCIQSNHGFSSDFLFYRDTPKHFCNEFYVFEFLKWLKHFTKMHTAGHGHGLLAEHRTAHTRCDQKHLCPADRCYIEVQSEHAEERKMRGRRLELHGELGTGARETNRM